MLCRSTRPLRSSPGNSSQLVKSSLCLFLLALLVVQSSSSVWGIRSEGARLPENLDPLRRSYSRQVEIALKALSEGVAEYQGARYSASLARLPDSSAAAQTAVGDFALVYRAKSYLALDKAEDALRDFRLLQKRFPASSQMPEALLGEAQALLNLGKPEDALGVLKDPAIESSSDSLFLKARACEVAGNRTVAVSLYLRLYTDFVGSKSSPLALQRLQILAPKALTPRSSFKALLQRADNLLALGKNSEARTLLLKMTRAEAPKAADYEKRELLLGQAEFNRGRTTSALSLLKGVTAADPEAHARALYLQGACYRRLDQEEAFLGARDSALSLHPRSPWTEKLLYSVATYFDVDHRIEESDAAYKAIVEHFPKGENAQRARWKAALLTYVQKNYEEALRQFWTCLLAYQESSSSTAAIYWMGRCYEKLSDSARALKLYGRAKDLANESYYGQRAREAEAALREARALSPRIYNGIDFDQVARLVDGLSLPSSGIPDPPEAVRLIIERARQLTAAGLTDFALAELRWGMKRFPDDKALSYTASRIFESMDDYHGVIATLRRSFPNYDSQPPDALPDQVWELLFPIRHWKVISEQAGKQGIDGALVLSIIRQESAFNEGARSSANARGLMQMLPSTGRRIAREAGVPRYTQSKLYSADTNITLGIRHLSSLLERYNGRLEPVLAAYNAGEHRADRWLQDFGDVDGAEFVERIPFSETRAYVRQVLTNLAQYRRLTAPLHNTAN